MANTIINIPYLPGDLTYTVDVVRPSDLTTLQADIALSVVSGVHQGTVSEAIAGRMIFIIRQAGNFVEHRIRSIADDAGPYTILTGLDGGSVALPVDPSDDDLLSTGWLIVYDKFGQRENGVNISIKMTSGPGTAGFSLDTEQRTATSATVTIEGQPVAGYVQFTGMRRGATFKVKRGTFETSVPNPFATRSAGAEVSFVVPDAPSFMIAENLGEEVAS
ncbi:MAG: hypothetical protein KDA91_14295 [Planctomycetaceae bacterium]|nr:hypothetical protein [Planctomycetaceae bacterium]